MRYRRGCETIAPTPDQQGRDGMPRIRITTEPRAPGEVAVLLDERICANDLSSDHFTVRLLERIGWAVADADDSERHRLG
jgi:hypothetical protein